jgi:hypothetical protein
VRSEGMVYGLGLGLVGRDKENGTMGKRRKIVAVLWQKAQRFSNNTPCMETHFVNDQW